jgi:arylsulfatase A-like enzyme
MFSKVHLRELSSCFFLAAITGPSKRTCPTTKKNLWLKKSKEITIPEDFYSSKFIVEKTSRQLEKNRKTNLASTDKNNPPFFSYVSFQAVRIPVQAPKELSEKYIGTYKDGWEVLRETRQQAVKDLGLLPADAPMKRMAVYAGRLVQYLKDTNQDDNTVITLTSDNDSEASDPHPFMFKRLLRV